MARYFRPLPAFLVVFALTTGLSGTDAAAERAPSEHDDEHIEENTSDTENPASVRFAYIRPSPPIEYEYEYQVTFGETHDGVLESALERTECNIQRCQSSLPDTDENEDTVAGDVVVQLTIRDGVFDTGRFSGGITEVELLDSNFDDESEFVECVLDKLQEIRFRFPSPEDGFAAVVTEVTYQVQSE